MRQSYLYRALLLVALVLALACNGATVTPEAYRTVTPSETARVTASIAPSGTPSMTSSIVEVTPVSVTASVTPSIIETGMADYCPKGIVCWKPGAYRPFKQQRIRETPSLAVPWHGEAGNTDWVQVEGVIENEFGYWVCIMVELDTCHGAMLVVALSDGHIYGEFKAL